MTDLALLQTIMRSVFDEETLVIDENASAETIAGWDSFANIQLLAAVEECFAIKFLTAEAMEVKTAADILKLIQKKKGNLSR